MRISEMLDLAEDCGLYTISEAYLNVMIHAKNMFDYETMAAEFDELVDEMTNHGILVMDGETKKFKDSKQSIRSVRKAIE